MFPLIFLLPLCYGIAATIPTARIVVFYASSGAYENITDALFLGKFWGNHLSTKLAKSPEWPFNATVEFFDTMNNEARVRSYCRSRFANKELPNVTAVLGPFPYKMGYAVSDVAVKYNIPVVFPEVVAYATTNGVVKQLPSLTSSFFILPAGFTFSTAIEAYIKAGVHTVFVAYLKSPSFVQPTTTCQAAANVAQQRGINVLGQVSFTPTNTTDDLYQIVLTIKSLNPDAVIWCDPETCTSAYRLPYHVLPLFKRANYLPKALSLSDCVDYPLTSSLYAQGLYPFVSSAQAYNARCSGNDYTEDFTPYSSLFRPQTPPDFTVTDQQNLGKTARYPSSNALFREWYFAVRGVYPDYTNVPTWAAFDVLESALFRAAADPSNIINGHLPASKVLHALIGSDTRTPYGRVAFDANNVNNGLKGLFSQVLPSSSFSQIVYPSDLQTDVFVYPMPTWEERVHTWHLLGGAQKKIAFSVSIACSVALGLFLITMVIYRREQDVRMYHYLHLVYMCLSAAAVCWGTTLLWQADVIQAQCNGYLWLVYLPASFMVQLVNVKAYRLSTFLTNEGRRPKPFSHGKVMRLTLYGLLITAILVLAAALADPPTRHRVAPDPYRAKLDYYYCHTTGLTNTLMYILVIGHMLVSLVCVISVRNGLDAFKDGTIIKDAFVLLYAFVLVTFILHQLQLSAANEYMLRSLMINIGVTASIARLLINRCLRHWLPESVLVSLTTIQAKYARAASGKSVHSEASVSAIVGDQEEAPLYEMTAPQESTLHDMLTAIKDPVRGKAFRKFAKKLLLTENVDFLVEVLDYRKILEDELGQCTVGANATMLDKARGLYSSYILSGSENEVNVSALIRAQIEASLSKWPLTEPLISAEQIRVALEGDSKKRALIFEPAFKEILQMLYQNIWHKFRAHEAEVFAGWLGDTVHDFDALEDV